VLAVTARPTTRDEKLRLVDGLRDPHARPDLEHARDRRGRSKDAAADWALSRLPDEHRYVLRRARAIYLGEEDERWDDVRPHVRAHADFVVAEIEELRRLASL
jgi:hypothetical protein